MAQDKIKKIITKSQEKEFDNTVFDKKFDEYLIEYPKQAKRLLKEIEDSKVSITKIETNTKKSVSKKTDVAVLVSDENSKLDKAIVKEIEKEVFSKNFDEYLIEYPKKAITLMENINGLNVVDLKATRKQEKKLAKKVKKAEKAEEHKIVKTVFSKEFDTFLEEHQDIALKLLKEIQAIQGISPSTNKNLPLVIESKAKSKKHLVEDKKQLDKGMKQELAKEKRLAKERKHADKILKLEMLRKEKALTKEKSKNKVEKAGILAIKAPKNKDLKKEDVVEVKEFKDSKKVKLSKIEKTSEQIVEFDKFDPTINPEKGELALIEIPVLNPIKSSAELKLEKKELIAKQKEERKMLKEEQRMFAHDKTKLESKAKVEINRKDKKESKAKKELINEIVDDLNKANNIGKEVFMEKEVFAEFKEEVEMVKPKSIVSFKVDKIKPYAPIKGAKPIVKVTDLKMNYGKLKVLKGLNLTFYDNDRIALLGVNGAGKTTFTEILAKIKDQTSGEIWYSFGTTKREISDQLGIQFQSSSYPMFYRVVDIIKFFLEATHTSISDERLDEMLDFFQILPYKNSEAKGLSGGQLQRLNIFLAVVHQPKLLFLDELSTGLDLESRSELKKFIKEQLDELKSTLLLVSHNPDEIVYLANRVIVLNNGMVLEDFYLDDIIKAYGTFQSYMDELFMERFKEVSTTPRKSMKDMILASKLSQEEEKNKKDSKRAKKHQHHQKEMREGQVLPTGSLVVEEVVDSKSKKTKKEAKKVSKDISKAEEVLVESTNKRMNDEDKVVVKLNKEVNKVNKDIVKIKKNASKK